MKIEEPKVCPYCGAPVIRLLDDGANIYCSNPDCPERNFQKVNFFVSKEAMDIEGLSGKTVKKLMDAGFVKNWYDLYEIHYDDLVECGVGENMSVKLLDAIRESRTNVPAERVLVALGIPMLGKVTAGLLLDEFKDIVTLSKASFMEISFVDGVGDVAAQYIADYMEDHQNEIAYVKQYLQYEQRAVIKNAVSDKLSGMTILATGTLKNFTRDGIKNSVENNGGKYASGVNKKLTFMIVGSEPGPSKIARANQMGIKMINEDEYIKIIND